MSPGRDVEVTLNPESHCCYWLGLHSKKKSNLYLMFNHVLKRLGSYLKRSGKKIKNALVSVADFQFLFSTGSTWDDNFSPPISSRLQLWQLAAESSPAHRRLCVCVDERVRHRNLFFFVILISGCSFFAGNNLKIKWSSFLPLPPRCYLIWLSCFVPCSPSSVVCNDIYIYVCIKVI